MCYAALRWILSWTPDDKCARGRSANEPGGTGVVQRMSALDKLRVVIAEGRTIRPAGEDIYSVLADEAHRHLYDRRAAVYDFVVGTRLYNFVMWGSSPREYTEFARQAFASARGGPVLDAACGSLLFSARAFLESDGQVIAFDQSLAMLQRARRRLIGLAGRVPDHVLLLQGELSDLPFRPAVFQTVLCMNVLHQYQDATVLIPNLNTLLADGGQMYLTSLVKNDRTVGDRYLDILHAAGEFVRPRSSVELKKLLDSSLSPAVSYCTKGNMAYATTAESINICL